MSSSFLSILIILCCLPIIHCVCPDQNFPPNPSDPSEFGPFSVGVVEVPSLEPTRNFSLRVFYPTTDVSGKLPVAFDMLKEVPPDIAVQLIGKLPPQKCPNCFWQAPLSQLGPFPLVVFIHGTAGWSTQSLHFLTHWASRGFIVASANYPGICMYDFLLTSELKPVPSINQENDTRIILEQLSTLQNPILQQYFGYGQIDMSRIVLSGHSSGAVTLQNMADAADILLPMAGYGIKSDGFRRARAVAILSGEKDTIVPSINQQFGYELTTIIPKSLLLLKNTGHQGFSDFCYYAADQGGISGIAEEAGIWQAYGFEDIDTQGCNFQNRSDFLDPQLSWKGVKYVSSAVMESILMCDETRMEPMLQMTKDNVGDDIVLEFAQKIELESNELGTN